MAHTDVTRLSTASQKKMVSVFAVVIGAESFSDFNAAGNYLVVNLPGDAIVTNAYIHTNVVSDAGAITLGTAEAGTQIMSAGDSTTLGKTGTSTGQVATGTGTPVYMSIAAPATVGEVVVVIEYLEYTKNTGEYTKITK